MDTIKYRKVKLSQYHFKIKSKQVVQFESVLDFDTKMYMILCCLRFTLSDQFHNEFEKFCFVFLFTLQKCHISTFWILEMLEKGGLYVLLATRPSSVIFQVGCE